MPRAEVKVSHNATNLNLSVPLDKAIDIIFRYLKEDFTNFQTKIRFTLSKKWRFPLRICSVNVIKSAGNCGFDHIY